MAYDTLPKLDRDIEQRNDKAAFESAMRALESEIASAGLHFTIDASARLAYAREIAAMSDELRRQATRGLITWKNAAQQANETRNLIMDIMRGRSTPVGRALAESQKLNGKTLNMLVAEKTIALFGPHADFTTLNTGQQNRVYAAIVESAGKSQTRITTTMRVMGPVGHGLIIISLALSIYTVANAENKLSAAGREASITGAGVGGGFAGGALAGLACGPAAPICVTVGAFVGGALAAFATGFFR